MEQAEEYRRYSHIENIKRRGIDRAALKECWDKIPAAAQSDPKIAVVAARCHIALGDTAQAARIIERSLADAWDRDLVALYAECAGPEAVALIERAESWLKAHPRDGVLLLALGKLCAQQELWGKAQSYLEASVAVEANYSAHLALAHLYERLGDAQAAQAHYRTSLELAVAQLKQTSGGRRRTLY
jgi:HemY protein